MATGNTAAFLGVGESSAIADINLDGYQDVVINAGGDFELNVLLGNGDGTLKAAQTFSSGAGGALIGEFSLEDFNGDGYLDISSIGFLSTPRSAVIFGNGDGSFAAAQTDGPAYARAAGVAADFNEDGVADLYHGTTGAFAQMALGNTREVTSMPRLSMLTAEDARTAMDVLDTALDRVSSELGAIGAIQSRLQIAHSTLTVSAENYRAAESRIKDADIAQESADLLRRNILQ
ncbi:unnamed protein product, partial [marine sediment metagenome]